MHAVSRNRNSPKISNRPPHKSVFDPSLLSASTTISREAAITRRDLRAARCSTERVLSFPVMKIRWCTFYVTFDGVLLRNDSSDSFFFIGLLYFSFRNLHTKWAFVFLRRVSWVRCDSLWPRFRQSEANIHIGSIRIIAQRCILYITSPHTFQVQQRLSKHIPGDNPLIM